jgi:hypothetical protein
MPAFFFDYVLPIFFLVVLVGAVVLWSKTRQAAALMQVIACSVIVALIAVEQVANYLMRAEKPQLWDSIHRPDVQLSGQIAFIICFIALPVGYLWYALIRERI